MYMRASSYSVGLSALLWRDAKTATMAFVAGFHAVFKRREAPMLLQRVLLAERHIDAHGREILMAEQLLQLKHAAATAQGRGWTDCVQPSPSAERSPCVPAAARTLVAAG